MVRELFTKIYARINWKNRSEAMTTALGATLLNRMDYALDETDNRIVTLDAVKAEESEVLQMVKDWTMDEKTGIITITKKNGEKIMFDLNIEKIPVSFTLSPQGILTMTTDDGTKFTADIGSMIPILTFKASDTINVSVEGSGINKTYSFSVKEGSIKDRHLQPSYLADITVQAQTASSSANEAQTQADRAKTEADRAKQEADKAAEVAGSAAGVSGVKGDAETKYRHGEVNITSENVGALALTGGKLSGLLTPNGGIGHVGRNSYIAYPSDGVYRTRTNTVTGYLKIILPQSWSGTFIRFRVSVYNNTTNTCVDYIIGSYCRSSKDWQGSTAICIGKAGTRLSNLPVDFGTDESGRSVIAIGTATTAWEYPQVSISDITLGWNATDYERWRSGWSFSIDTTPLSTTHVTIENTGPTAESATKATQDGNGNVIANSYMKKVTEGKSIGAAINDRLIVNVGWNGMASVTYLVITSGSSSANTSAGAVTGMFLVQIWYGEPEGCLINAIVDARHTSFRAERYSTEFHLLLTINATNEAHYAVYQVTP